MQSAKRADRLELHRRIHSGVVNHLQEWLRRRHVADLPERTNRFDEDAAVAAGQQRHQHRQRRAILERTQSLHGERARVWIRVLGQREERRQAALVFEALQRVGHRPPRHFRPALGRRQRGRRQGPV